MFLKLNKSTLLQIGSKHLKGTYGQIWIAKGAVSKEMHIGHTNVRTFINVRDQGTAPKYTSCMPDRTNMVSNTCFLTLLY